MSKLVWDQIGERLYETGVEKVAIYPMSGAAYPSGAAWNGVTALNLTPSGAEPTNLYANNSKYIALLSAEELGFTLEAYTYPDEFAACDGQVEIAPGVYAGQQARTPFGLVAKTIVGNDSEMNKHGYKLHILYGCQASPSEKAYATINDSPEAATMSWEGTTTPVAVNGHQPTSYICIDSTKVDADKLAALEEVLYGGDEKDAELPLPDVIASMLAAA